MSASLWLLLAGICSLIGIVWLALSLPSHAQQARRGATLPTGRQYRLRQYRGGVALVLAGVACLQADHPGMALLVWIMLQVLAALSVSSVLAWRPRVLKLFVR